MIVTAAGMRDWKHRHQIFAELDELLKTHLQPHAETSQSWSSELPQTVYPTASQFILRHGASGNADNWADEWGRERGVTIERFEAEWHGPDGKGAFNPSAGPIRNRVMAKAEPQSDLWLAFWDGKFKQRGQRKVSGTFDGITAALEAGIEVSIKPPRAR